MKKFKGKIWDKYEYDRVLTKEEVDILYNNGKPLIYNKEFNLSERLI